MTHTEAADLILRAVDSLVVIWSGDDEQAAILAAVATVMDAARADAFKDAADLCELIAKTIYDDADRIDAALECRAAIRARAQAHREPKP